MKPVKRRWVSIVGIAITLVAVAVIWWRPNPPYTIEIRHIADDGTVTYQPQKYKDWNHTAEIAGLRKHTRDIIYHSVYYDGLTYSFSRSGRVYAMAPNQNDLPCIFDREWSWSGDPHDFPYYDYSKVSPHVKP